MDNLVVDCYMCAMMMELFCFVFSTFVLKKVYNENCRFLILPTMD